MHGVATQNVCVKMDKRAYSLEDIYLMHALQSSMYSTYIVPHMLISCMHFAGSPRKNSDCPSPSQSLQISCKHMRVGLRATLRFFYDLPCPRRPAVDYASRGLRPHGLLRPEG